MVINKKLSRTMRFTALRNNWPSQGEVIESLDEFTPVTVATNEKNSLVMRVDAVIDNQCTGWYLSRDERGVVVLIDLRDHDILLEAYGMQPVITRLQVYRYNQAETAIIGGLLKEDREQLEDEIKRKAKNDTLKISNLDS